MKKERRPKVNWSSSQVLDYKLIKNPESNKSHIEKRKEKIEKGEVECSEWWLCWRNS